MLLLMCLLMFLLMPLHDRANRPIKPSTTHQPDALLMLLPMLVLMLSPMHNTFADVFADVFADAFAWYNQSSHVSIHA